ncbi:MAG: DUF6262 family protein [Acetobacteraceae bacterium]|nr:DUF6262 family protein [Acetobacteraceae bacterium]
MAADSRSGPQKGADNVERLRAYLAGLGGEGRALPERGGKVNVSAVALACGFDRNVLYTNPAAKALLEGALSTLGLAGPERAEAAPPAASGPDPRDRRINQLEQANASLKAENGALRAERNGLRERLRRLEHIEAHMVETGRRVAP